MKRLVFLVLSILCSWVWLENVIRYQKLSAFWGPFSVPFMAIVLAAGAAIVFLIIPWFLGNNETAPWKMVALISAVCLVSILGGAYMTEPIEPGATISSAGMQLPPDSEYDYHQHAYSRSRSGGSFYYFFYGNSYYGSTGGSGTAFTFDMPSCSGKSCGQGLAMLFLAICALLVLIASFVVPHFWVAGGLIFLVLGWMVVFREFFLVHDSPPLWVPNVVLPKAKTAPTPSTYMDWSPGGQTLDVIEPPDSDKPKRGF